MNYCIVMMVLMILHNAIVGLLLFIVLGQHYIYSLSGSSISKRYIDLLYSGFCLQGSISAKHQFLCQAIISVAILKSSHAMACEVESEVESLLL